MVSVEFHAVITSRDNRAVLLSLIYSIMSLFLSLLSAFSCCIIECENCIILSAGKGLKKHQKAQGWNNIFGPGGVIYFFIYPESDHITEQM